MAPQTVRKEKPTKIHFSSSAIKALTGISPSDHDDGYMAQGLQVEAGKKIKNVVKDAEFSKRFKEFNKLFDPDNPKLIEAFTGISESDSDKDYVSKAFKDKDDISKAFKALQQKAAENFKKLFIDPTKCFPISEPFGRMGLISKLIKECGIEEAEAEQITDELITGKSIALSNGKNLRFIRLPFSDPAPKYWFEII